LPVSRDWPRVVCVSKWLEAAAGLSRWRGPVIYRIWKTREKAFMQTTDCRFIPLSVTQSPGRISVKYTPSRNEKRCWSLRLRRDDQRQEKKIKKIKISLSESQRCHVTIAAILLIPVFYNHSNGYTERHHFEEWILAWRKETNCLHRSLELYRTCVLSLCLKFYVILASEFFDRRTQKFDAKLTIVESKLE
jgi:hypothetical protein